MGQHKHTPGPRDADTSGNGGFTIDAFDGNTRILCSRAPWPGYEAESLANARLMAAAPDLLEAAKGALWALDNVNAILTAHGLQSTLADPTPELRAAIAKATVGDA